MQPKVTPLRWWSQAQLDAIGRAMLPHWSAWLSDWAPARLHASVSCELAWDDDDASAQAWNVIGDVKREGAWIGTEREPAEQIGAILFGSGIDCLRSARVITGPLARAVSAKAVTALGDSLRVALQLDPATGSSPAPALFQAWSGAAILAFSAGESAPVRLLISGECAERLIAAGAAPLRQASDQKPRPALAALDRAAAELHVRASVRLAECELDLGTLASLRAGDVIPLAHALDAPLQVVVAGQQVCGGYLGRHGDAKAIELARHDAG